MNKSPNILICPLEWGLGHAARMIPLAKKLRDMNHKVYIGAGEKHLALFRSELTGLTLIKFPGFSPGYSRYFPQYFIMLLKTPVMLFHIILEHYRLKKIIRKFGIDIVISDNRFGLWNKEITSVYVTHLLRIPLPRLWRLFESIGILLHRAVIKRYSLCFIPDLPGKLNFSGRLSHEVRLPSNVRFTGIMSRFAAVAEETESDAYKFRHNTVILSGPEPQRSILKKKLTSFLKHRETTAVILEGRPDKPEEIVKSGNIISYNHLATSRMRMMIKGSESIISRAGYTTIMDLICLNCSALLIPTPGQTEQEYLAAYLSEKGWFFTISQNEINERISLPAIQSGWPVSIVARSENLLNEALSEMLEKHHKNYEAKKSGKKS